MDIQSIKLFIEVAQHGSFAATARSRNIDPSMISRVILNLETELDIRLFHRTTRHMTLTEAGEIYLSRIRPALEEIDNAHRAAEALVLTPQGKLRLTVSNAYAQQKLIPLLGEFRLLFPGIELDIVTTDLNLDLAAEKIDLAIRLAPMITKDLVCKKLHSTRYKIVASPAYLKNNKPILEPRDLSSHQSVLFHLNEVQNNWTFKQGNDEKTVPVNGALTFTNPLSVRQAVLAGYGPALLANWLVKDDLRSGECIDLFPNYDVTATTFDTSAWLLYLNRQSLPIKVRAMIGFLEQKL